MTTGGAGQAGWTVGVPMAATIRMDDNGGGNGWFFDTTPLDDAEFTAIVNSGANGTGTAFQASFVDATGGGTSSYNDFYRTITHEIGHALGISLQNTPGTALRIFNNLFFFDSNGDGVNETDTNPPALGGGANLVGFFHPGGGVTSLTQAGGGHIYEGGLADAPQTPRHPNDLMNDGRTVPAGQPNNVTPPVETTRQFISDVDVRLLRDAYDYIVEFPSNVRTAHATLDSLTGTLLVQGRARNQAGQGQNDVIIVDMIANVIRVRINPGTANAASALFPVNDINKIVIAGNGGADNISTPGITLPVHLVDLVVSSNEDSANAGTLGDGVVDLDSIVPGAQVSLRAAVRDTNGGMTSRSIYVPRGNYRLTLSGTGGDTQGDLDIMRTMTIIGSGPGATIIDGSSLATRDRIFDVSMGNTLNLSYVTLTGGQTSSMGEHGGAIVVRDSGVLNLSNSTLVNNRTTNGNGGAIYFYQNAAGTISNSVITANNAAGSMGGVTGGVYLAKPPMGSAGVVTVASTIIASNTATQAAGRDVFGQNGRTFTVPANSNNRLTTIGAGYAPSATDYVGTVDYVVTDATDSFNHANDTFALSLREAIDNANVVSGTQEIWLPAWGFILNRARTALPNQVEMSIQQGDLEIFESLTIRGITSATSTVRWRSDVLDKAFELVGDYNGDLVVDAGDYVRWRNTLGSTTYLEADGDDDGVVDVDDYGIWNAHYGNGLTLLGVSS